MIDLDKFQVDLATSLKLVAEFPIQMKMVEVRQGRTVVEWMIPSELLDELTSLLCSENGQAILAVHQISDVVVDGRPPAERHAVRPCTEFVLWFIHIVSMQLKRLLDIFDEGGPVDENMLQCVKNVNSCNKVHYYNIIHLYSQSLFY